MNIVHRIGRSVRKGNRNSFRIDAMIVLKRAREKRSQGLSRGPPDIVLPVADADGGSVIKRIFIQ